MLALRALTAGVAALAFAGFQIPAAEGSIPGYARTIPAVGGNVGDVITTTCGNSPVIILAIVVCETRLPAEKA